MIQAGTSPGGGHIKSPPGFFLEKKFRLKPVSAIEPGNGNVLLTYKIFSTKHKVSIYTLTGIYAYSNI